MNKNFKYQLIITLIAALLFIPFLGRVHLFDWDEINFAESAREMILTGDYLTVSINYTTFWEKPPLFTWVQVLSMKLFGINEFAARFPNAITGIITLLVLFNIGKKLYDHRFGLLWALVYAGSILPHFYFKSGIIDPLFNLFIFLGIYYFIVFTAQDRRENLNIFLSGVFIGLAILTKGPVGFLLFFLSGAIFMVFNKLYKKYLNIRVIGIYAMTVMFVGGFWFILQAISGNYDILVKFIKYQIRLFTIEDAGHGGFLFYHFVVLFIGVFPASVFVLKSFRKYQDSNELQSCFRKWMIILFWVVLILFTIVNTKIVHYSSMCYFPMSFLASYVIYKIINGEQKLDGWMKAALMFTGIIIGSIIVLLQLTEKYKVQIIESGIIKDEFAVGNLGAVVHWSGFEFLVGFLLIAGISAALFLFKNTSRQIIGLFIATLLFTNLTILVIVPKVEQYSQNAAIRFYKKIASEDCYLDAYAFKSYAIFYYFNKRKPENKSSYDQNWLLTGPIDKPVYIVCKNFMEQEFVNNFKDFKKIDSRNGFLFFKREIPE
jgi:4-amino-4-deoxy-L-arabinose transferase-like glycosyltransferase